MKTLLSIAGLIVLSLTAHAQYSTPPQTRLKPLYNNLELYYLKKDSAMSKMYQFEKPGKTYSLFPKSPIKNTVKEEPTNLKSSMPIMVPDPSILFSLLTLKPDSTIAYPMPVIKP